LSMRGPFRRNDCSEGNKKTASANAARSRCRSSAMA
jgi:hypothetical protein